MCTFRRTIGEDNALRSCSWRAEGIGIETWHLINLRGDRAEAEMRKQVIVKEDFTPLRLPGGDGVTVAQCIRAGNFVFLSGQTAFNEKSELVGVGDARVQA